LPNAARLLVLFSLLALLATTVAFLHARPTVGRVLRAQGLQLQRGDEVQPPPAAPYHGGVITVVRRRVRRLPPPLVRRPDPSLLRGRIRLLTAGKAGRILSEERILVTPRWVRRTTVERRVLRPARPRVVAVGTATSHLLVADGVRYRYRAVVTMVATAYNGSQAQNGPWGAVARDGRPLTRGMAAVDPHVIPLGTRLYVAGYGPALAADTGSAIKGDRIDLYLDEGAAAVARFGVRAVRVYILV
jgi:3D (Asp-Asp-Asp) domain-containing protein